MQASKPVLEHVIAFYNLENLFDTKNDPYILDDDFTPKGFKRWKERRYRSKLGKLGKSISRIGEDEQLNPPVLLGIAEVENGTVINKLIKGKYLRNIPYDFVHFDSPDERGIDTALIYNKEHFEVLSSETLVLYIENEEGKRDYTRDILYVNGKLNGENMHIFVNHWPSRREGEDETKYKRIKAAQTILKKLSSLDEESTSLNVVIMGDFNDDPRSESIATLMDSGLFINPMQQLLSPVMGSANYKGKWSLFDQIILSHSFLNHEEGTHSYKKASIFAPKFLREWKGKYKGNPFRTYVGKKYIGGYSDHFPVYVVMRFNESD